MQIVPSLCGHAVSSASTENACRVEGLTKGQALLTLTAPGKENWIQVMSLYLLGSTPECTVSDYLVNQGVDISKLDASQHSQYKDPVRRFFETTLSAEYLRQAALNDGLNSQIAGLARATREYVRDLYISKEHLETKLEGLIAAREAAGGDNPVPECQVELISARIEALQKAVKLIGDMRSFGDIDEDLLLQYEQKEKLIEMAARGERHHALCGSLAEHAAVIRHLEAGGYRIDLGQQETLDDDRVQRFLRDVSNIVFSAAHAADRTAFQGLYWQAKTFSNEFRGRQESINEWSESLYPGTINRTAPYSDLMFSQPLLKTTDRSIPNLSAGWPTAVAASEVQSFVNSTSGFAFMQFRLLLELGSSGIEENKLFGVLSAGLVFLTGGHNLEEVMAGYHVEELQKFMPTLADINMQSVFGDTSQGSPLALAFEKTWEFNEVVCNKLRVNHEIVRLAQQLSAASTPQG
ncbi:hypothetical protein [Pseudomonas alkylphenolica]|uniref:hypothetical protein n=1 Tax=Pseudomonas alkylphenolica TaxID=237609 RepID=UPI0018D67360|nr:hypothetical protein [Pseudomonas alkylphenolica]MBH3427318.1 hypothetical protein [Pseudomonas alkylphenolica]